MKSLNLPSKLRVDVQVHRCHCPLCKEPEEAYFFYGNMSLEQVKKDGRRLFSMESDPALITYWHFEPRCESELNDVLKREAFLVNKITTAPGRLIKMTIIGPCQAPATRGRHAFYIDDAFAWPPVETPDGMVVKVPPKEVRKVLADQQPAPVATKPESEQVQTSPPEPGGQNPPGKPNPIPTPLFVPPELR